MFLPEPLFGWENPDYTGIYKNEDYVSNAFRENFPPDKYLVTLPEWLKDSAGYFTYNIDKIFHCDTCDQQHPDFDDITMDPCSRSLSWNKQTNSGYDVTVPPEDKFQGVENLKWGAIDSANVITMADFRTADTAKNFIDAYANDPSQFCNKPFFLPLESENHIAIYLSRNNILRKIISPIFMLNHIIYPTITLKILNQQMVL